MEVSEDGHRDMDSGSEPSISEDSAIAQLQAEPSISDVEVGLTCSSASTLRALLIRIHHPDKR